MFLLRAAMGICTGHREILSKWYQIAICKEYRHYYIKFCVIGKPRENFLMIFYRECGILFTA